MQKQATAYQKYIKATPRKLRLVADLVRGLPVGRALSILQFCRREAAGHLRKVIIAAQANALAIGLRSDSLVIKSLIIEEGSTLKRFQPVSRGRAHTILKHNSHLKLTLLGDDRPAVTNTKADSRKGK
jgi:large subunit ribosomal protein L22